MSVAGSGAPAAHLAISRSPPHETSTSSAERSLTCFALIVGLSRMSPWAWALDQMSEDSSFSSETHISVPSRDSTGPPQRTSVTNSCRRSKTSSRVCPEGPTSRKTAWSP